MFPGVIIKPKEQVKYIISGTGRSGTKLIHNTLKSLGADVGKHELTSGNDGGVGSYNVLNNILPKTDYKLIVQMRDPIQTINSVLKSNPSDFPSLDLYKKNFDDLGLYTLNAWYLIHTKLIKSSVLNYTLSNLNNGDVSSDLIKLFNLNCTKDEFNEQINLKKSSPSRNARLGKNKYTKKDLELLDSDLVGKSYELYYNIDNANKKT